MGLHFFPYWQPFLLKFLHSWLSDVGLVCVGNLLKLGGREGRCLNYAVKSGSVDTMHYTLLCLTIKIVVHIEWGQGGAIRWSPGQ